MAKRAIKLSPTSDMDELSDAPGVVTETTTNEPIMATPMPPVVQPPVVQPPKVVTPKGNDSPKNVDAMREEIFSRAKECGVADGKGKKAFVQFARTLVDGGASGALSVSPKQGDALKIYNAFIGASAIAAGDVTDEQKASTAAQVSKAKAFIRLGNKYAEGGECEVVFNRALGVHRDLMATKDAAVRETIKYKSTYTALYAIAVAQCRPEQAGKLLEETDMRELLTQEVVEQKEKDAADILIDALNAVEKAKRGKAATKESNGRDPCNHPALPDIIEELRATITDINADKLKARDDEIAARAEAKAKAKAEAEKKKADAEAVKAKKAAEAAAQAQAAGVTPEGNDDEEEETEEPTEGDFEGDADDTMEFGLPSFNLS